MSSGGGVNDDDFSMKLTESRAYIRLRGGKSDSSSVSDGLGVTSPFGSSMSFSLRFNECSSSDFCNNQNMETLMRSFSVGGLFMIQVEEAINKSVIARVHRHVKRQFHSSL